VIPISFATVMDGMFMQLPQIDFTFGIGDIVGSIALLVSAFTFYISYTQSSQSEQIKISRDIWARIDGYFIEEVKKFRDIPHTMPDKYKMYLLLSEIDYFAYLILRGEIKDRVAQEYYKKRLVPILPGACIGFLYDGKARPFGEWMVTEALEGYDFHSRVELVEKWNIKEEIDDEIVNKMATKEEDDKGLG
jgi:hypothetical protein